MSDIKTSAMKRIVSAAVALPAYAYFVLTDSFQNIPVLIVTALVSLVTLHEYYTMTKKTGACPFVKTGLAAGLAVCVVMYLYGFGTIYGYIPGGFTDAFDARIIMALLSVFIIVVLLLRLFKREIPGSAHSIGITIFGVIYIVFFFSHLILLKALRDGAFLVFLLNAVVMINDSGAYFGGVLFGTHKVGLKASPNKTWEGYFSGLLFSIIFVIVINQIYASFFGRIFFGMVESTLVGVILSFFGSVGDLVESMIKRDCDVKDSGALIPGHGGMWDVFDALMFSLPPFYYFLVLTGIR